MKFTYDRMFYKAVGRNPYPYQSELAEGDKWPKILNAPTGAGKTAASALAWVWKRHYHPDHSVRNATPRRLVYCLPMRVLVEQTRKSIEGYLQKLGLLAEPESPDGIGVHVLMGGDIDDNWYLYPERDMVIIGTQDMLISRALNRGYALSRFQWPIQFGLLNNDALWVLDEVQLMGAGLKTTAQLAAFREMFNTILPCPTLWMSATIQTDWLQTVDHDSPRADEIVGLGNKDRSERRVKAFLQAPKLLQRLSKIMINSKNYPELIARRVLRIHHEGTQTIIMVNTVDRAQQIYSSLKQLASDAPEIVLLHSRYRPPDRKMKLEQIESTTDSGRIIVCTQVLEAGVDISSKTLFTELAPWSGLVQRFGRCNRFGEYDEAYIYWIDSKSTVKNNKKDDKKDEKNTAAPYDPKDLDASRKILRKLNKKSAAPSNLPEPHRISDEYDVIRKKDILDLFDTTPDLSGNDIDVSCFIRDVSDRNVWVAWRDWPEEQTPPADWPAPGRDELCPVPIASIGEALKDKHKAAFTWDHLERNWRRLQRNEPYPGQAILLRCDAGGYNTDLGWKPGIDDRVSSLQAAEGEPNESIGDDPKALGRWQTLAEHSAAVVNEIDTILTKLGSEYLDSLKQDLLLAAELHDYGKSHHVFQQTLLHGLDETEKEKKKDQLWAKSEHKGGRHSRPHFRHELASLLGLLAQEELRAQFGITDLTLYLVASHHGRVRLGIRNFPKSKNLPGNRRMILGIKDGDRLPHILGSKITIPAVSIDLSFAEMGIGPKGPSWLARSLELLQNFGPFRLAYLEALLRAADARASAKEVK